jgi:hypothetical protein
MIVLAIERLCAKRYHEHTHKAQHETKSSRASLFIQDHLHNTSLLSLNHTPHQASHSDFQILLRPLGQKAETRFHASQWKKDEQFARCMHDAPCLLSRHLPGVVPSKVFGVEKKGSMLEMWKVKK